MMILCYLYLTNGFGENFKSSGEANNHIGKIKSWGLASGITKLADYLFRKSDDKYIGDDSNKGYNLMTMVIILVIKATTAEAAV